MIAFFENFQLNGNAIYYWFWSINTKYKSILSNNGWNRQIPYSSVIFISFVKGNFNKFYVGQL